MCCCCPSAISALFCLWIQSGCSKGTVAGALTFFPPDPALYEFERHDKHGKILAADEEAACDEQADDAKNNNTMSDDDDVLHENNNNNNNHTDDDEQLGEITSPGRTGPLEVPETKGQTKQSMRSPVQQLTDQVLERRKRSKQRNLRDTRDRQAGVTYKLLLDPRLQVPPHEDACIHALKIPTKTTSEGIVHVAAVLYTVPPGLQRSSSASSAGNRSSTKTLIYSHGNATDLGAMFPLQVVLSHSLNINVLVYDYSGYGESGGVPDEISTYRDIDAVYEYVWEHVAAGQSKNIVLYGQSVGSGPCCYLAAKLAKEKEDLGGMILHSPFTSGMRVLTPSRLLGCLDIYPNIDRIKKVQCPVMLIHGHLDQEVDISHGQEMYRAVPEQFQREPWWVPDRGHNDVTEGPGKLQEYVRRLRFFLNSLDE